MIFDRRFPTEFPPLLIVKSNLLIFPNQNLPFSDSLKLKSITRRAQFIWGHPFRVLVVPRGRGAKITRNCKHYYAKYCQNHYAKHCGHRKGGIKTQYHDPDLRL